MREVPVHQEPEGSFPYQGSTTTPSANGYYGTQSDASQEMDDRAKYEYDEDILPTTSQPPWRTHGVVDDASDIEAQSVEGAMPMPTPIALPSNNQQQDVENGSMPPNYSADDVEASPERQESKRDPEGSLTIFKKPEAAPVAKPTEQPRPRNRRMTELLCPICLILIALAIVLPLALRGSSDSGLSEATPTPTMSPTLSPGWIQLGNMLSGSHDSEYGTAVAVDANLMAVGGPGNGTGMVRAFRVNSTGSIEQLGDYFGLEDGDRYGASLDITGNFMVVGAPLTLALGTSTPTGAAFAYQYNPTTSSWDPVGGGIRGPEDIFAANEEFATAVSINSNNRVAIGAPLNNGDLKYFVGRVYTFDYNITAQAYTALEPLPMLGAAAGDHFGTSVALSDDGLRLIAGAPGNGTSAGYAELFSWTGIQWDSIFKAEGTEPGELFGSSVAMLSSNGDTFAIGAPGFENGAGRVVVYQQNASDGSFSTIGPSIGLTGLDESGGAAGKEYYGAPKTISGGISSSGPSLAIGTANGVVRTYDFDAASSDWVMTYPEVDVGFKDGVSSLSATQSVDLFVVGGATVDQAAVFTTLVGGGPSHETEPPNLSPQTGNPGAPTMSPTVAAKIVAWIPVGEPFTIGLDGPTGLGASVAMEESIVVAGAPSLLNTGCVMTIRKDASNNSWIQGGQIFGEVNNGTYGAAVDLSADGNSLVVGAPTVLQNGTDTPVGAAYVYSNAGEDWNKVGSTIYGDSGVFATDEEFGSAVAISSSSALVVGAPGSSYDFVYQRGRIYIFGFAFDWTRSSDIAGSVENERFGSSVDISDNGQVIIVGSPGSTAGYASIYSFDGSSWNVVKVINGEEPGEAMGSSVAILSSDGALIAAGGPGHTNGAGRVVVFEKILGDYQQIGPAILGEAGERLGDKNSISGKLPSPSILVGTMSGGVRQYDYDPSTQEWINLVPQVDTAESPIALSIGPNHDTFVAGGHDEVTIFELGEL